MNRNLNSNFPAEVSRTKQVREYFCSWPGRIYTKSKKFLAFLAAIIFLLFSYFLFRVRKNYFSVATSSEEKLSELTAEEIFSETSPVVEISEKEVVVEANQLGLDPTVEAYYQRIITKIHSGNIHGEVIIPWLRSEEERVNNTPYSLCSVANCQWTAGRKQCEHHCYFRCPESNCGFYQLENYSYYDYCSPHSCHRCRQLVVIYEDNHYEKYCSNCLPKTVADYQTPYES